MILEYNVKLVVKSKSSTFPTKEENVMIKRIIFGTDLPIELFAVNFANMICEGLESFSIWPNQLRDNKDGIYVFAYRNQPPEDVLVYLSMYAPRKDIHYFFTKDGENWSKDKSKKGGLRKTSAIGENSEQKNVGTLINTVHDFLKSQTN
jgi:hypothetical protein